MHSTPWPEAQLQIQMLTSVCNARHATAYTAVTSSCPNTATARSHGLGSCCSGCVCTCNPWQAQLYTCPRHCCPKPCTTVQPATIINPHMHSRNVQVSAPWEGPEPAHATANCGGPWTHKGTLSRHTVLLHVARRRHHSKRVGPAQHRCHNETVVLSGR